MSEAGPDLDVVRRAYGWTFDRDGELHGLTAGDMGYEPARMWLDPRTKAWVDHAREREDDVTRLRAERDALYAALRDVLHGIDDYWATTPEGIAATLAAKAALAKARGEQP